MSTGAAEQALALPLPERGPALLALREDQWFERKSSRIAPRDLAEAIVGFANAEGGLVVIGLHGGVAEGVDRTNRVPEWQQSALDHTTPAVPCRTRLVECLTAAGGADHLLVIEVETSDKVHANRRDEVYLRVGDENRKLTFAQRQELLYDKGQATFESTPVSGADRTDLDDELLSSYAEAVNHPDPDRLLAARGLVTRAGELTVAAVLLFARHPQTWFPEASIRVLRYQGTERGTGSRQQLTHDVRLEGPLPTQLIRAREEVAALLPSRRALAPSGRFERVGIIPQDAWLEGIVNAAVHRSYSVGGDHIRVEIFDDRVEVESPGRFPGIAEAADPLHVTRFARNPRVARVCADLAFGQELGEGLRRMFEEMRLAGLADPAYRQTSGSVRVTLTSTVVDRALEASLPPGARDLVRIIREAGRASTGEIVEASGRSRPVVLRNLRALQQARLIDWNGHSPNDPRAYWSLALG
ncbi:MAG TPA: ATP-binding protein [Acidimicrobiales bacterium]|nr:ATP-binding protein [Acidimicrobiales bacterium]